MGSSIRLSIYLQSSMKNAELPRSTANFTEITFAILVRSPSNCLVRTTEHLSELNDCPVPTIAPFAKYKYIVS